MVSKLYTNCLHIDVSHVWISSNCSQRWRSGGAEIVYKFVYNLYTNPYIICIQILIQFVCIFLYNLYTNSHIICIQILIQFVYKFLCQSGQVCHVRRQSAGGGQAEERSISGISISGISISGLAVTIVPHGTKNVYFVQDLQGFRNIAYIIRLL